MRASTSKEEQRNVPIDSSYHKRLKIIAGIDETSMKAKVQEWIDKDGRGKIEQESPKKEKKPVAEKPVPEKYAVADTPAPEPPADPPAGDVE